MSAARERTLEAQGRPADATRPVRVLVDGVEVVVDVRTFTMRERKEMRQAMVATFGDTADEMDALTAGIWIAVRRDRPDVTLDDIADVLTLNDLLEAEPVDEREDGSPEA